MPSSQSIVPTSKSKILWITNIIFPDAAKEINLAPPVHGGWMYGLAKNISENENFSLAVASIYSGNNLKSFKKNFIQYYLLPKNNKDQWKEAIAEFLPDITHIHGTEFSHGMEIMNAHPEMKYIISLQGMVSLIHRYYFAGINHLEILQNITIRDIIRRDTIFHAKRDFYKRGLIEKEYIRRATDVIGRTDWDRIHAQTINSKVTYHFCNESLRDEFYTEEHWSLKSCRQHSVFLSQAGYPIKGLHQVLKAISLIKDSYPDITIEIAGYNITASKTLKEKLTISGYGKYIRKIIRTLNLTENVRFLGLLNAEEMKKAYLRSHIFICPSSIENSPNSLGEAQILGLPCIASYCGGIPSMIENNNSALLYRFEEYEMLASNIKKIFSSETLAKKLSYNAHKAAKIRHDRKTNLDSLISIYNQSIKFH